MKDRPGLAVVGLGRISEAHLNSVAAIPEEARLVAVVSRREETASLVARQYGAPRYYLDLDDALADPEVDGVVLCTPNRNHMADSIRAARAGKHVLVEKIMANTVDEADAMIEESDRRGTVLMVAQCRRFFRATATARDRMEEIGKPIDIIHFLGVLFPKAPAPWWRDEDMGSLVMDMNGPHVVDTILWLMGQRPIRVYAQTSHNNPDWPGADEATLVITFESGATATGHLSFNSSPEVNERYVVGSRGTMRIVGDRELWINGEMVLREESGSYLSGGPNFVRQMQEFVAAIREGREPEASGRQVREVVRVLEAARRSASLDQAVPL